jgi:uncharacterized protein
MLGYRLLRQYGIPCDILCVVHAHNVKYPLEVYRFFKQTGAECIGFLPLVAFDYEKQAVSDLTVPAESFGAFLCTIFDEWLSKDIGHVKVQIFEEAITTAFGQDHALCIFRKTCGDIPVVEHNGDFFPCDHFVDMKNRIGNICKTQLVELIESPSQKSFGQVKLDGLTSYCRRCDVLEMCNGGCPKDRFAMTPAGEPGLSYLCAGYKRFFTHCRPFVEQLSSLWHEQQYGGPQLKSAGKSALHRIKTGRNDPCPCGSGRKYKKCCMDRE